VHVDPGDARMGNIPRDLLAPMLDTGAPPAEPGLGGIDDLRGEAGDARARNAILVFA
jgi:hypothetical protein